MEHILREGEPGLRQDLLIYGKEYQLYRDGQPIGTGFYEDDPNIGDCFLHYLSENQVEVMIPDEWVFL